jgi:hypothetical protein
MRLFRNNKNPLSDQFAAGIKTGGTSFEAGQNSNMRPLINMALDRYLVPWFMNVLAKLDQATFHREMSGIYMNRFNQQARGKDFLADLRNNHSAKWRFLMIARRNKGMFTINVPYQVGILTNAIRQKGWTLYQHEVECFNDTLLRLNALMNG